MAIKKIKASAGSLDLHNFRTFKPDQDVSGASAINGQGRTVDGNRGIQLDWPNNPSVHDRDDDRVSSYAYQPGPSLDHPKGEGSNY